jgi:hypothetical protein
MATLARGAAGAAFRPSFHLWMTLLMALFVFGGFGMTYLAPLALGTFPPAPPVVHLHGVVFFAWTILLVLQSVLVNVRSVKLHRSLGTFGIALAAIVFFAGLLITVVGASAGLQGPDDAGLFYLSLVAPPSFAVLFAMAIRATRTPQVHRNLILLAMISILMPGINRFYQMGLGLGSVPFYATYLTMDAMLATILWHERGATGAISRATWIAAAIIVVPQFFLPLVAPTDWFAGVLEWLGSLVYYR